jgi:hypothetical protein
VHLAGERGEAWDRNLHVAADHLDRLAPLGRRERSSESSPSGAPQRLHRGRQPAQCARWRRTSSRETMRP